MRAFFSYWSKLRGKSNTMSKVTTEDRPNASAAKIPLSRPSFSEGMKFTGVIGSGMVGRSPFDRSSWSGISYFFFLRVPTTIAAP